MSTDKFKKPNEPSVRGNAEKNSSEHQSETAENRRQWKFVKEPEKTHYV